MHPQRVRNNLKLHGPMLQVINNPKGIRNPKLSLEAGIKATKKKKKERKRNCVAVSGGGVNHNNVVVSRDHRVFLTVLMSF